MNKNVMIKITIAILLVFAFTLLYSPKIMASGLQAAQGTDGGGSDSGAKINTKDYKVALTYQEGEYLFQKAAKILTVLRAISIMIAIICLSIIGIKFMIGSLEEKANYKEKLLPVAIGCMLIASLNTILLAINSIMNS